MLEFYAVRDNEVGVFLRPFVASHVVDAKRGLSRAVQDPEHHFSRICNALSLYRMFVFHEDSGQVDQDEPVFICALSTLKAAPVSSPLASEVSNG